MGRKNVSLQMLEPSEVSVAYASAVSYDSTEVTRAAFLCRRSRCTDHQIFNANARLLRNLTHVPDVRLTIGKGF